MNRSLISVAVASLLSCASHTALPVTGRAKKNLILNTTPVANYWKPLDTKQRTVALLNQLFNSDISSRSMILMINNHSECDMVLDIFGSKTYSLPISAKKSESIILEHGNYQLNSQVCESPYRTFRTFTENTQLNIKYQYISFIDSTALKKAH